MTAVQFPADFLWGAATAAHQVEGGNVNSDWWEWEHRADSPVPEPSGRACEHYTRYADDIGLLADLGLNTYRFSVEWARIEPSDGQFDQGELDHYRAVTQAVRAAGVTPMVTLHHFTLPQWLAARGGWLAPEAPDLFARYCERVVRALGDAVDWWCTLNEPGNVAVGGYLGVFGWPPGTRDLDSCERATSGLVRGHQLALAAIKSLRPQAKVGATHGMQEWVSNGAGRAPMRRARRMFEDVFLEAAIDDDYVGVQSYTRVPVVLPALLGPAARLIADVGPVRKRVLPGMMRSAFSAMRPTHDDGVRRTDMGYEFRPEAIGATLRRAAELLPGKDLVVTEHGIATTDDTERVEFILRGLASVAAAIDDGLPVRGYLHWSLLDNFEWAHGYRPTFGLIGVDRTTMARTARPSARLLGDIARAGALPPAPR
ncbi:MAG: beta-glucosidase [Frankiaceae bacterium]|nr:beta-glucosidase [Frankiaceae bacterium]